MPPGWVRKTLTPLLKRLDVLFRNFNTVASYSGPAVLDVSHVAVRALLLAGKFPPMERGILDKTHLHFYTLDTARALLQSAAKSGGEAAAPSTRIENSRSLNPIDALLLKAAAPKNAMACCAGTTSSRT